VFAFVLLLGFTGVFLWWPFRWINAESCLNDLNQKFPAGTPKAKVETWLQEQPHTFWSRLARFDKKLGNSGVEAIVFNKRGEPAWSDDYMQIGFYFDEI